MRFRSMLINAALMAAMSAALASCGSSSTQDAPGAWGASDTNLTLTASLSPASASVDVCNCLSASTLSADFSAKTIYPDLPDNTLHLDYYTVTFIAKDAAAPSIAQATHILQLDLPASGVDIQLVSAEAKAAHLDRVSDPSYSGPVDAAYTVQYVFYAVDDYGTSAGATAYATATLGKGSDCAPPAISPSSISLTGIENPDADASDDIAFTITGGTEPYKAYSNNEAIINAPGDIAPGAGGFIADPDLVSTETDVTLTVVDAFGLSATAVVNVRP